MFKVILCSSYQYVTDVMKNTQIPHQINSKQLFAESGAGYFFKGFELIRQKGVRRFVFIPLAINLIIFSVAFSYLFGQVDYYMTWLESIMPQWLTWISYLLWPLAVFTLVVVFSYVFSTAANWLAAPFNGLLSEKIEKLLTGKKIEDAGFSALIKDVPRTLAREWHKLTYYLPRAIGFFLLLWFLPVVGQILWFLFTAWMMAIQYKDYPFDNHKISFDQMKNALQSKKGLSYSFGITVVVFSMIPIVNLIVMPVAICGATALWVDHYKNDLTK
jgi:CysZ protein